MTRLGSEIVYEMLGVAEDLAGIHAGSAARENASCRRAVSTAYYALFHALSSVCAETLAGADRDETIVDLLYRALDHTELARALKSADTLRIDASLPLVEEAFRNLLERRQAADYAPASFLLLPQEALDLIEIAREAISALERLSPAKRLRLAVHLLAKSRTRQTRR